ncbi:hypothetical protein BDZ45DRAFT_689117 [Acephala macrosclerotiorum]|nr:hypothetical protein BDZ45DRAFT_689117 [Acephala macrosclerotiorum]
MPQQRRDIPYRSRKEISKKIVYRDAYCSSNFNVSTRQEYQGPPSFPPTSPPSVSTPCSPIQHPSTPTDKHHFVSHKTILYLSSIISLIIKTIQPETNTFFHPINQLSSPPSTTTKPSKMPFCFRHKRTPSSELRRQTEWNELVSHCRATRRYPHWLATLEDIETRRIQGLRTSVSEIASYKVRPWLDEIDYRSDPELPPTPGRELPVSVRDLRDSSSFRDRFPGQGGRGCHYAGMW